MKHLELFAGIGGFRRAMDLLTKDNIMEFDCIGYSEIDSKAIDTYRANYQPDKNKEVAIGDIVAFTTDKQRIEELPHFDFLTGGFPCQTFSMMGNQLGFNEERGQMFFRIMDIIEARKPKYVLLENVKNLKKHDKGRTFTRIKFELENQGYKVFSDVFNTAKFHLPQTRNRVIIFATTDEVPSDFEDNFTCEYIANFFDKNCQNLSVFKYESVCDILSKTVPQKYYLSDKIKPTVLADGSANFRSKSDINMSVARPLTATMHKMHRACQDNYYSQDYIDSRGAINPVKTMSKAELSRCLSVG